MMTPPTSLEILVGISGIPSHVGGGKDGRS